MGDLIKDDLIEGGLIEDAFSGMQIFLSVLLLSLELSDTQSL